jgi:hypothetical protein
VEQGLYHQQDHYPNSSYAPALASKDFLNPNREEEGSSKVVVVKPQPLSSSDRLKKYKRFIPQNYLAKFLTILISVFVGVVFGWFIYQWTKMEEITGADGIAIITPVRNQSYRVKPKEPGGKTIPHQNLSIFDDPSNVDSLDAQGGESLLQEPEEDIQYLIAQKDPVIEDGQNTNSNGYPNHIDELTQSQNRPRHHDEVYSSVPQRPEKEDIVRTAYTPPPLKKEPNYHNGEEGYDESTQDSMTSLPASVDYVDTEKRSLSAASNPPVSREPVGYLVETDHGPVIVKNPNHQGGRISRPRGNGHETKNNDVLLSADQDSSELQSDTLLSQQPQRSTNDFSKSMSIAENDPNIVEEKKTVEPISKTLPPLIIKENFYIQIAEGIKSEAQGVNHWKKLSEKPDVRKMLSTYEGILKFDTNAKKYYLLLGPFSVKDSLKAQKISQKLNVKFLQKYID